MRIVLVTGSTRPGSTNSAALRTAHAVAPVGVETVSYEGLAGLPAFVPGDGDPPTAVAELRATLDAADAVLICTPEYAGTLPGSLKNLLDWTVGTGELHRKPVAWINVAAPGRGEGASATLATVLGYVDADVIAEACVRIFVHRDAVGPDGLVADPSTRDALASVLSTIAGRVRIRG